MRYTDIWIGRLIDGLADLDVFGDTMLVLTAGHGEGLWGHGERSHGHSLYQEQIHVPLIVHYPGMRSLDGRRISTPVSAVDVAPTILRAFGIDPPSVLQGADLEPLIRGRPRPASRAPEGIFSELGLDGRRMDSVRLGRRKLIRHGKGSRPPSAARLEFYDLESGPGETGNPAADFPQHSQRLAAVLREWRAFVDGDSRPPTTVAEEDLYPETRENLRVLGYIE